MTSVSNSEIVYNYSGVGPPSSHRLLTIKEIRRSGVTDLKRHRSESIVTVAAEEASYNLMGST